ncbi:MAG: hypothetical protein MZV65_37980 [Chromatiales bacterium]|nr:hypothetical protein [Chromatiales bacterium]
MNRDILATLRLIGMLAVVLLGMLAVLVVLDIVPRELLQSGAVKLLLVLGVVAVVALVVSLLARKAPGG